MGRFTSKEDESDVRKGKGIEGVKYVSREGNEVVYVKKVVPMFGMVVAVTMSKKIIPLHVLLTEFLPEEEHNKLMQPGLPEIIQL